MRELNYIKVRVYVRTTTDKAVFAELANGDTVWLPKSQLDDDIDTGETKVVGVADWLVEEHSIPPYDDGDDDKPDPIVVFSCRPVAPRKRVAHDHFGEGLLVEDRGDRSVVDFPQPHGRRTILRSKLRVL